MYLLKRHGTIYPNLAAEDFILGTYNSFKLLR